MFVLLASIIPRSFIFAEYKFLTAVLVDTELQGNYLFWGMTHSAKTAQLREGQFTLSMVGPRPDSACF